jgi:hypothetical protein
MSREKAQSVSPQAANPRIKECVQVFEGGSMRRSITAIATGCVAVCAAVLWPVSVHAQEIKAGFSWATISFLSGSGSQELSNTERLTGFVGGVAFLLPGSSRGGVQIEALFHQKGARNLLRRDDQLRLTYVEVPVLLHIFGARSRTETWTARSRIGR